jgi:signal transduction histidine kinase
LPNVIGDSERIGQVFTNLIGNAIKFTPDGGSVTVNIRPEGTYILAQVIDTGPGIPIDKQEKIFDKFYQLSEVQTRQQGGSGLGLSIVKSIVEAHGGRIWVKSQEGKGSDFRFILPIAGITTTSKS